MEPKRKNSRTTFFGASKWKIHEPKPSGGGSPFSVMNMDEMPQRMWWREGCNL
ncbi:hypothetical protein HMPREF1988_01343 [Porphyromonas gingivalis F0185]|nr:hypothetical protein HMPREF1553_02274 [Porphyromonas gingivalis F0568]ERJ82861.1 hypothetical protein HMPREF1988_01343 [Porphyromonas gingivalis F0185]